MYLNEYFSGCDNKELIGCFLGFQTVKVHLNGLITDDLRELISIIQELQEGEMKVGREAERELQWIN